MVQNLDDKLFCEVGMDLGMLTQEQVTKAIEAQKIDSAVGVTSKRIGAYFLESEILTREQIGQILKVQERYAKSEANTILNTPSHEVQPEVNRQQQVSIVAKAFDEVYCSSCGKPIKAKAEICPICGVRQLNPSVQATTTTAVLGEQKSKNTFQILGFLLGGIGFHNFYIGKNGRGFLQFCLCAFSGGNLSPIIWVWALVEIATVKNDSQGKPLV